MDSFLFWPAWWLAHGLWSRIRTQNCYGAMARTGHVYLKKGLAVAWLTCHAECMTRHEYIVWYRDKIAANLQHRTDKEALRMIEVETLQQIIRDDRPSLAKEYEFYWRGFVLPKGSDYDALLAKAAEEVRATREEGQVETDFDKYIARCETKQVNAADESFEEESERHEKEDASPARRAKQASLMQRLRSALSFKPNSHS
jgi:hypothetical protein